LAAESATISSSLPSEEVEDGSTSSPARWRTDIVETAPTHGKTTEIGTTSSNVSTATAITPKVPTGTSETGTISKGTNAAALSTSIIPPKEKTLLSSKPSMKATTQWGVASTNDGTKEIKQTSSLQVRITHPPVSFLLLHFITTYQTNPPVLFLPLSAFSINQTTKTRYTRYGGSKSTKVETSWCCRCSNKWNCTRCCTSYWYKPNQSRYAEPNNLA
jgi:hypothetical protein